MARPRFAVRSFMMNSNRLLPGFSRFQFDPPWSFDPPRSAAYHLCSLYLPRRKSCGFAKLKAPKAPELHIKAKRPLACCHYRRESRFLSFSDGAHIRTIWSRGVEAFLAS